MAFPCGLGFLRIQGLGFKGKNNIVLLCKKERPTGTLSLMLRPSELEHTEGKDHLETGHSKPNSPEFIYWLDTGKTSVFSLQ